MRGRDDQQQSGRREVQPVEEDQGRVRAHRAIPGERPEIEEPGADEPGRGAEGDSGSQRRQGSAECDHEQPLVAARKRGRPVDERVAAHGLALATMMRPCIRSCGRPQYTVQ